MIIDNKQKSILVVLWFKHHYQLSTKICLTESLSTKSLQIIAFSYCYRHKYTMQIWLMNRIQYPLITLVFFLFVVFFILYNVEDPFFNGVTFSSKKEPLLKSSHKENLTISGNPPGECPKTFWDRQNYIFLFKLFPSFISKFSRAG